MHKVELVEFPKADYRPVTQLGQYIGASFAFVNEKYEEIMQRVMCKDFMNVPNWQRKTGKDVFVYGWRYDFKTTPYDVNTTRISFEFKEQTHADNFVRNIRLHLNKIEEKYGIKPTVVLNTQHDNVKVIEGDTVWQSNCWKVSTYMMYLRRCGHNNFLKPHANSSDHSFKERLDSIKNSEHNILTNIHNDYDSLEANYSASSAHSGSGLMSMLGYARFVDWETLEIPKQYREAMGMDKRIIDWVKIFTHVNPDFKEVVTTEEKAA